MKAQELRQETSERLAEMLKENRRAILDYRVKAVTSHDLNPKDYRRSRKDIARILTILKEREAGAGQASPDEERPDTGQPATEQKE